MKYQDEFVVGVGKDLFENVVAVCSYTPIVIKGSTSRCFPRTRPREGHHVPRCAGPYQTLVQGIQFIGGAPSRIDLLNVGINS